MGLGPPIFSWCLLACVNIQNFFLHCFTASVSDLSFSKGQHPLEIINSSWVAFWTFSNPSVALAGHWPHFISLTVGRWLIVLRNLKTKPPKLVNSSGGQIKHTLSEMKVQSVEGHTGEEWVGWLLLFVMKHLTLAWSRLSLPPVLKCDFPEGRNDTLELVDYRELRRSPSAGSTHPKALCTIFQASRT